MSDPKKNDEALRLRPMTRSMQAFAMLLFFLFGVVAAGFVILDPFELDLLDLAKAEKKRSASTTAAQQLYQCPMHPEVIEEDPDTPCPICKMRLSPIKTEVQGPQLYQCPMHPEVIEEDPDTPCPICKMKLSPMKGQDSAQAETGRDAAVIRIDPVQVQNIGVVSEQARLGEIDRTVRTVGFLDFNSDRITWINTKFAGWIEKVHVTYVGQEVLRGEPLFDIYSPELVTTQEEYLRALDYRDSLESSQRREALRQAESLLHSTRDRLAYWDIDEEEIIALERRGVAQRSITITSPANGVVTEVMDQALEGMRVDAGMNLYKIADLSTVWVHADVYQTDLPWVQEGQPAEVSFRHDPDRRTSGEILFLYPEVSKETRTLKICVEIANPDRHLRPGMYADVVIHGPPVTDAVTIPTSSVLRSGQRNLVFVELDEGRFEPREVTLGIEGDDARVEVLDGVSVGERVVTQAQFMLDSESRVQEAIAKFMKRRVAP